ncbi:hypothetical protein C8J57DRAFT_1244058 [Mycena rebaudengoi]|nr:hypothetical protein C8J57DRAFT_1244058 [Mycena rebaudengoi]
MPGGPLACERGGCHVDELYQIILLVSSTLNEAESKSAPKSVSTAAKPTGTLPASARLLRRSRNPDVCVACDPGVKDGSSGTKTGKTRNPIYLFREIVDKCAHRAAVFPDDKHFKCYYGNPKFLAPSRAMKSSLDGLQTLVKPI